MAMPRPISDYASLVFDCDGVILDANRVKTQAFQEVARPWGREAASALVAYHVARGGISRYHKLAHFRDHLVPAGQPRPALDALLAAYAASVADGLRHCAVAAGLRDLRQHTPAAHWLVVSGGDQAELRAVFGERGLADLFDGGIHGSPETKHQILSRELARGNIPQPALFLGDSRFDHEAARASGLDFLFISDWTEVADWQAWCAAEGIAHRPSLRALLPAAAR